MVHETTNLMGSTREECTQNLIEPKTRRTSKLINKPQVPKEDDIPLRDENKHKWLTRVLKASKLITYAISFVIVLSGATFSKISLLLMTSQLKENRTVDYCLRTNDATEYTAKISDHERSQWIWGIFFVFFVPEALTILRSARICIFKRVSKPALADFILVTLFETLHTIGIALFVFVVLPEIGVTKGAMLTNCVAFVPAILLSTRITRTLDEYRVPKIVMDVLAILAQMSGFIVWPVLFSLNSSMMDSPAIWAIPVSLFLISLGWWENYVPNDSKMAAIKLLSETKDRLQYPAKETEKGRKGSRYPIYLFVSVWKILVFLLSMSLCVALTSTDGWHQVKSLYDNFISTDAHTIQVIGTRSYDVVKAIGAKTDDVLNSTTQLYYPAMSTAPIYVLLVQIFSAYLTYTCGKFACQTFIQGFGFAFPLNLAMPVTVTLLISACANKTVDVCNLHRALPPYLYWDCEAFSMETVTITEMTVWVLWLLSQAWITIHIWVPKNQRIATADVLFVAPKYSGILVDQSLGLNRRRQDIDNVKEPSNFNGERDSEASIELKLLRDKYITVNNNIQADGSLPSDKMANIPRIFACATMWHETKKEMITFLQSIFRMDAFQGVQRLTQAHWGMIPPDYYEFTTHIYFDDAFKKLKHSKDVKRGKEVNEYVQEFYNIMKDAARKSNETKLKMEEPKAYVTPYGGRLEWTLPGETRLIVHLKDKGLIRPKKRWSQCMYMFQLLRFERNKLLEQFDAQDEVTLTDNMFLMALDGDIDFKPESVQLLVDLMKKNGNLGAACGRIHPTGSGWMVWYQKFEYAIGHWLQKSTEHVLGCVLCSPGCFSLFRGSALMKADVMWAYTKNSEEARHYIQYDQGEDRWLCTLLLQQGFRVEYSAASDAFTQCPEGFGEFFNQRRRWLPSTMANILDLLSAAKKTRSSNDSISFLYILYQVLLMFGTILGPGTIFLMLVGSVVAAFGMANRPAFLLNLIPITIYTIVCFTCNKKYQILLAELLTAIYSLVMMAVLVGICLQVKEDGWTAPSSVFLVVMFGSMFIAAALHPLEIGCILHIVLYWMVIPSMYLLLVIFCLANMNDVSWGTRENAAPATNDAAKKTKSKSKDKKGFKIKCGSTFSCTLCGSEDKAAEQDENTAQANTIATLEPTVVVEPKYETWNQLLAKSKDSTFNYIQRDEKVFWNRLIKDYLSPLKIDIDKAEINKKKNELITLRNKTAVMVLMVNMLFVLIVSLLQLNKDIIYINWPIGANHNVTFHNSQSDVHIDTEYLHLEPVGFIFVIFFGVIIVIQFVSMLIHRAGTWLHIMASIYFKWFKTRSKEEKQLRKDMKWYKENVWKIFEVHDSEQKVDRGSATKDIRRKTLVDVIQEVFENAATGQVKTSADRRKSIQPSTLQTIIRRNTQILTQGSMLVQNPELPSSLPSTSGISSLRPRRQTNDYATAHDIERDNVPTSSSDSPDEEDTRR